MKFFLTLFLLPMTLMVSGCDTLNQMGSSVGNSLKSISLPSLTESKKDNVEAEKNDGGLLEAKAENCPQVKVLSDLSSIYQFKNPAAPVQSELVASTTVDTLRASCTAAPNSVSVELEFDFKGMLGPVGVKDLNGQANYTYPYFLAVLAPDGSIMAKDVFALSMIYENQQITYFKRESLRQVIPLLAGQKPEDFQIIVGFQLSEAELTYNRNLAKPSLTSSIE
jgi:hypothetical protein